MEASLQLKNYHVIETIYKNDPFFGDTDYEVSPRFMLNIDVDPNSIERAIVGLGIELGDEKLEKVPHYIKARIIGMFEFVSSETVPEEQIMQFYKVNAVAILFPYLRSLITDISSKGNAPAIILPTINIVALMEQIESETKKLDDIQRAP